MKRVRILKMTENKPTLKREPRKLSEAELKEHIEAFKGVEDSINKLMKGDKKRVHII